MNNTANKIMELLEQGRVVVVINSENSLGVRSATRWNGCLLTASATASLRNCIDDSPLFMYSAPAREPVSKV